MSSRGSGFILGAQTPRSAMNFYLFDTAPRLTTFVLSYLSVVIRMPFDPKAILANLVEQERIKGHHSAEGRAIRMLARALSGWSADSLSAGDVLVLCDQAIEDWLKARLKCSPWSVEPLPALLRAAIGQNLISSAEMNSLKKLRRERQQQTQAGAISANAVETALQFCIELIERHW